MQDRLDKARRRASHPRRARALLARDRPPGSRARARDLSSRRLRRPRLLQGPRRGLRRDPRPRRVGLLREHAALRGEHPGRARRARPRAGRVLCRGAPHPAGRRGRRRRRRRPIRRPDAIATSSTACVMSTTSSGGAASGGSPGASAPGTGIASMPSAGSRSRRAISGATTRRTIPSTPTRVRTAAASARPSSSPSRPASTR